MVNLELYKVFYTVAQCGSLTKAADQLFISQPAVSQAIRQLETQLGTPLFTRVHKGMELSAQGGELVYADVEEALQILSGVEERLQELRESGKGIIRIGASETIFQYALSEKIVEYHNMYPRVKIELVSDVSPKIIELMRQNRCDVGFLNLPIETDDSVGILDSIMILHDIFIAGQRYSELKGKQLSVWDLQKYPLLLMEEKTVARSSLNHFAKSHGVRLSSAVEIDSWGFMKRLVVDGMGIGCIPREYSLNKLKDGSLFELNVEPRLPSRSVGMALSKNVNMTFALRAFLNMFNKKHLPVLKPTE